MKTVLFITANPKQREKSNSLSIGHTLIDTYRESYPRNRIIEIDVYNNPFPLFDKDVLLAREKLAKGLPWEDLNAIECQKMSSINKLTEQFMKADIYIFAFPMWNLSVPPLLKAYIDTIKVPRKTFRKKSGGGTIGLLQNKKAVIIESRGDDYSSEPYKHLEFSGSYVKTILSFLGVEHIESIIMQGMDQYSQEEAKRRKILAVEKAKEVAKAL